MIYIIYLDLETGYKKKLNGSISLHFKYNVDYNNYQSITSIELFDSWIDSCTSIEEGKRYYINRGTILKGYEIDEELLQDLKELFESRLIKNIANINKKLNTEKATDKQIAYVNKLYKKLNGEDGKYKAEDYTKAEIGKLIEKLLEEEKSKSIKETSKVINLFG